MMNCVALSILCIVALSLEHSSACSCPKYHLQSKFCDAEVAFHGQVVKKTSQLTDIEDSIPSVVLYDVKIIKVFKKADAKPLSQTVTLVVKGDDLSCNSNILEGHEYLILSKYSDSDLEPVLCGGVHQFDGLTQEQSEGITGGYSCECKVVGFRYSDLGYMDVTRTCFGGIFSEYTSACLQKHAVCQLGSNGYCKWQINLDEDECAEQNGFRK